MKYMPDEMHSDISAEGSKLRVLMITSEYPTEERPNAVPFIVRQVEYLSCKGVDVELFAFKGNKRIRNYAGAWFDLRRATRNKRFDLIHAQWGHSAVLALPKRLPWVITFRGNDLEGIVGPGGRYTWKGQILTMVSKFMGSLADERIVVSESLGERLGKGTFTVIPSGLDLDLFKPLPMKDCRRRLGLPQGKKLALFAASTIENPRKRYDLAKQVVDELKKKYDIDLVVANKVPHSEIPIYMSACDALLLTSVHEGSPNVVKEALACDLPVVSVDVGDVRQRLSGVAGCRISEDDSLDSIAKALDDVLRRDARIKGRQHVADLDENRTTDSLIRIYRQVARKDLTRDAASREVIRNT